MGLFRRKNYSSLKSIVDFIDNQVKKFDQLHGYKWLHLRCIQAEFKVKQETVRQVLKIVDPESVELRSRRLRRRRYSNCVLNIWTLMTN